MTGHIPNPPDKIPIENIPRVYGISPFPEKEYIDASTNVRLIVSRDVHGVSSFDLFWTENTGATIEEINEAIARLMTSAGLAQERKG